MRARADGTPRDYARFVGGVTLAHALTYLVVGAVAYELVYERAIDAGGLDAYMRSPEDPAEWRHVETWLIPAQLLRGFLYGLALCPFLRTLAGWRLPTRLAVLFLLLMVFSVWSVTMPGSGSIEGWLYLRPNAAPTLPSPLLGYVEVPAQLLTFSLAVSWWIRSRLSERQTPVDP